MARPQVADGGDGLHISKVAANILNKQLRTADKMWSSSLGLTTPQRKELLRNVTKSFGLGQILWINDLS
jgi:hypothetical protein